ncbi:hypothetical protein [Pedobacter cryoconitis]|uniref:Uncharacterized protein n=1 Tax=Pedobacter cryoconitis TaxID=188932 RepID=A0A7X0J8C7_9SPHI|nr:hypothetical protein [Pedobacter cryoconitis]MBB6502177.1 hypothetical protein [Pedobacter cryoconitis]
MKLFKVHFSKGKAHSPQQILVSQFRMERNCNELGELKWLIVFAEDQETAIELATKNYQNLSLTLVKYSRDSYKAYLQDFVA